jgi:hypothetical protein
MKAMKKSVPAPRVFVRVYTWKFCLTQCSLALDAPLFQDLISNLSSPKRLGAWILRWYIARRLDEVDNLLRLRMLDIHKSFFCVFSKPQSGMIIYYILRKTTAGSYLIVIVIVI